MQVSDFDFALPKELIAQFPLPQRTASRLMCVDSEAQSFKHLNFADILDLLMPGDLLVFNNTKVIPARLRAEKPSGGKVAILLERILDSKRALVQLHANKSPRVGDKLILTNSIQLQIIEKAEKFYQIECTAVNETMLAIFEQHGEVPLPPYMQRNPVQVDKQRYQTVYAKEDGSVAAPTAGLHFDDALLDRIKQKGVSLGFLTLHIGAGTFTPVRVTNIAEHTMHPEYCTVPATLCQQIKVTQAHQRRVIAVGTTTMRALESAVVNGEIAPFSGETKIFIYPGYQFNCADVLITNLHLPCSTLLMLVCAFAGQALTLKAYQEAVAQAYRFFSYGDAMWLTRC